MSDGRTLLERPLPIMIKFWAGGESHDYRYIKRSLQTLFDSDLPECAHVILIDDQSTDRRVIDLVASYRQRHPPTEIWRNPERMGPNRGHAYNFPLVVERFPEARLFMLCDDDVIYHPGWLQRLVRVYEEASAQGIKGVFSALNVPTRPAYREVHLPSSTVLLKERQMALNWLLPLDVYERVGPFRDAGIAYDSDYANRLVALNMAVICLKPSYVQNIGYFGAYQKSHELRARDYVGRRDLWLRSRDVVFDLWMLLRQAKETAFAQRLLRPLVKAMLRRS